MEQERVTQKFGRLDPAAHPDVDTRCKLLLSQVWDGLAAAGVNFPVIPPGWTVATRSVGTKADRFSMHPRVHATHDAAFPGGWALRWTDPFRVEVPFDGEKPAELRGWRRPRTPKCRVEPKSGFDVDAIVADLKALHDAKIAQLARRAEVDVRIEEMKGTVARVNATFPRARFQLGITYGAVTPAPGDPAGAALTFHTTRGMTDAQAAKAAAVFDRLVREDPEFETFR